MDKKQRIDFRGVFFVGAFMVTLSALDAGVSNDDVKVRLKTGMLVGSYEDDVRVFKNIPFAAPPVRNLRWSPPQPPLHWDGERAADKFGPPCAQLDISRMAQAQKVMPAAAWLGAPLQGEWPRRLPELEHLDASEVAQSPCYRLLLWSGRFRRYAVLERRQHSRATELFSSTSTIAT